MIIKLHLGCGSEHLEGYTNIDIQKTDATDMVLDCTKLTSFKDNSVDEICAYHLIEHLLPNEFVQAVLEWYRVLKVGGKMVLECPDLEQVTRLFSKASFEERYHSFQSGPPLISHIYGGRGNPYELHKNGYTKFRLIWQLRFLFKDFTFGESHKDYKIPCIHLECIKEEVGKTV